MIAIDVFILYNINIEEKTMMTTYELIRRLAQVDPTGTKPVMLSINTLQGEKEVEATGFIDEIWVEHPEGSTAQFIVLSGVDN